MKLFIPEIGTKLTLSKPWTFKLYCEDRNTKFAKCAGVMNFEGNHWWRGGDGSITWNGQKYSASWDLFERLSPYDFTIPKGTELIVDRIYIRKGASNFSSVSFRIAKNKTLGYSGRFWVKLDDVNTMEIV